MSGIGTPVLIVLAACAATVAVAAGLPIPRDPLWKPVRDSVYLQEIEGRVLTDHPLLAVAVVDNVLYVGSSRGLERLDGEKLAPVIGPAGTVSRLKVVGGALYAFAPNELWRLAGGKWAKLADGAFVDVCAHLGQTVLASKDHLYRLDGSNLVKLHDSPCPYPILGVASYSETLYVRHADQLGFLDKGAFNYDDVKDWGHLPLGSATRDMMALGHRLLVPTDKGLSVLRGMSWYNITGKDGLCYEDTTCVARGFAEDDCWIGTTRGAIREVDGEYQYFGYQRWIPNGHVNAIACGDRVVYIATNLGLGIIRYEPYTLQKKAAWYERWIDEWGMRRLGFISQLIWDDKTKQWVRFISDNDGGWTGHLLNAYSFKYAVTKDPAVREQAVEAFRALRWTEVISGIPGFPARAIATVGEPSILAATGSAGLPSEWNPTPDGKFLWKGDTSSDEVDSHFQSTFIFYELAAQGKDKDAAREHLRRIMGHIVDKGWVLRDLDGKPTRWARWDPDYFKTLEGANAAGLQSLEILSKITSAAAITGDDKFKQAKKQLLEMKYDVPTLRQKLTFPVETHFDDRLAWLAYHPLLTYEQDPELRSLFRRGLERSWEVKRMQNMVWFNYIYGALTGNDMDNERCLENLQAWPLDCHNYTYQNSHRTDLQRIPKGYTNYVSDWKCMTARDIGVVRWDHNFMQLDGGGVGSSGSDIGAFLEEAQKATYSGINDPSAFLDAYWMARYYGMILPPDTKDPKLLTVEKRNLQLGAKPYSGPGRPDLGF